MVGTDQPHSTQKGKFEAKDFRVTWPVRQDKDIRLPWEMAISLFVPNSRVWERTVGPGGQREKGVARGRTVIGPEAESGFRFQPTKHGSFFQGSRMTEAGNFFLETGFLWGHKSQLQSTVGLYHAWPEGGSHHQLRATDGGVSTSCGIIVDPGKCLRGCDTVTLTQVDFKEGPHPQYQHHPETYSKYKPLGSIPTLPNRNHWGRGPLLNQPPKAIVPRAEGANHCSRSYEEESQVSPS